MVLTLICRYSGLSFTFSTEQQPTVLPITAWPAGDGDYSQISPKTPTIISFGPGCPWGFINGGNPAQDSLAWFKLSLPHHDDVMNTYLGSSNIFQQSIAKRAAMRKPATEVVSVQSALYHNSRRLYHNSRRLQTGLESEWHVSASASKTSLV